MSPRLRCYSKDSADGDLKQSLLEPSNGQITFRIPLLVLPDPAFVADEDEEEGPPGPPSTPRIPRSISVALGFGAAIFNGLWGGSNLVQSSPTRALPNQSLSLLTKRVARSFVR